MIPCSKTRAGMKEQKAGATEAHHKGQRRDRYVYGKQTLAEWWNMGLFMVPESRDRLIQNIWISASEKCYQ